MSVTSRTLRTCTLLAATYWVSAACARPQYVSAEHASLQSPVTLGEGNTGKPALDQLPAAGGRPAAAPAVHPPTPALGTSPAACNDHAAGPSSGSLSAGCSDAIGDPRGSAPPGSSPSSRTPSSDAGATDSTTRVTAPDPVALALGTEPGAAVGAGSDSSEPAAASFDPRQTPDPALAPTGAYYELTLRYCDAGVHLVGARRVVLKRPTTLSRLMGRFAAELWIGHELLERDRFDFPLLAADSPEAGKEHREPPALQLGPRADVVWKVKVADRVRATQAWVIDRASGERWLLDWPPQASLPKPTADAPCPSFGGK